MATVSMNYGSRTEFTITSASLTNTSLRESDVVDNSTNKFVDVLVTCFVTAQTGPAAGDYLDIYAYTKVDDTGPKYSGDATGSDAAYSGESKNLAFVGRVAVESTTQMEGGPFSLRAAFGGTMPDTFGIVIDNETDGTLSATETACKFFYQGIKYDSA